MAHFAELDENNTVKQVIVVHNNELLDESGNESEQKGINFCKLLYGENTNWVQTSYNSSFRKRYAGMGMTYDVNRDAFISIKPYPSWSFDEETFDWIAPVTRPEGPHFWDEDNQQWIPDVIL
jgi:hypothetical protein